MILPHFNSLQTLIEDNLTDIKKVDWFNDQYNRYEDIKALPKKLCLIEFPDTIDWQARGNGVQQADVDIRLHLVVIDIKDSPVSIYQYAANVYQFLDKKVLWDGNDQLSTELVRVRSTKITPDTQVKVIILDFRTNIIDTSASPQTIQVSPTFVVN